MLEKILLIDFGSADAQLISRKIRELNVFCEIVPFNKVPKDLKNIKGIILSDGPHSVLDSSTYIIDLSEIRVKIPILSIGYGAQLLAYNNKAEIESSPSNENIKLDIIDKEDDLLKGIRTDSSFNSNLKDKITSLPKGFKAIATSENNNNIVFKIENELSWGLQIDSQSVVSSDGLFILENFVKICKFKQDWSPERFIDYTISELKTQLGNDKVVLGLSGGVDSSVTAVLLNKAIGKNLYCIFVNHGLLRKHEFVNVLKDYEHLGLNVIGVDASEYFYDKLKGVVDPEKKRKIIGSAFIDIFDKEAKKLNGVKWLAQGTIYPDIIESVSATGSTIKSHHNVGGLPEKMDLKLCEPLKYLFKDEVRKVGYELGMMRHLINRHPFPGPGLGVRILGDITAEKVRILQEADHIFVKGLRDWNLYDKVWQAGAILLPVQSVGVTDGKRTYENAIALRAVSSIDATTAEWVNLPYEFLAKISNDIITEVKGINRVVYDISSKPPATIEWE